MIDADVHATSYRLQQLASALISKGVDPLGSNEPVVRLIPKRTVETWIPALLGDSVDEGTDYSDRSIGSSQTRDAAKNLHAHAQATAGSIAPANWPSSLVESVPEWRKIPKA